MIIFVAAASKEAARVREAYRIVRELGQELAIDWLTPIEAMLERGLCEAHLSLAAQAEAATANLDALDRAELIWLLAPARQTKGAWVDLGYALHRERHANIPLLVSGPGARNCVYASLATWTVPSEQAAIATIGTLLIARGGR